MVVDASRISGLLAADLGIPNPFEYADIVVVPSHRNLNGPLGSMIYYNKQSEKIAKYPNIERRIRT